MNFLKLQFTSKKINGSQITKHMSVTHIPPFSENSQEVFHVKFQNFNEEFTTNFIQLCTLVPGLLCEKFVLKLISLISNLQKVL